MGKISLQLPVPPKEYWVENSREIGIIEMQDIGQVDIPGSAKSFDRDIECMFPAQRYPFLSSGAVTEPKYYIDIINRWIDEKTVVRYVIPGAEVNIPVRIGGLRYGEKDGTNDVYATINIRKHTELTASSTVRTAEENKPRAEAESTAETTYTVVYGDTFWAVAQRFYGDGSFAYKLAAYNGIANPNVIKVGQVIKIPDIAKLRSIKVSASAGDKTVPAASVKKAEKENVKLFIKGTKEYWGRIKVVSTDKFGRQSVAYPPYPVTILAARGSIVAIDFCGEHGHSWAYATFGKKKIKGVGRVVENIQEDTTFYVSWVK